MAEKEQLSLFVAKPDEELEEELEVDAAEKPPRRRPERAGTGAAPPPPEMEEPRRGKRNGFRTAEEMGAQQREISVAEFFTKNRHLLGFDNPSKALLTTVKEAVDNSLDAAEEAGILPDIRVVIEPIGAKVERLASGAGNDGNG
ncbi:MAG: DNA topoisomerase VI subunit B, partial [Planctomycetes bacterium]|nr:DNA topoisomerase VI subunit B [Planctomycetota bacterium]